jgi:hypothetical protein
MDLGADGGLVLWAEDKPLIFFILVSLVQLRYC